MRLEKESVWNVAQRSLIKDARNVTTPKNNFYVCLNTEKMILDLDSKLSNMLIKLETSGQEKYNSSINLINKWMEDHNYKDRSCHLAVFNIQEKSREKIFQLLRKTK
jgi:hypothetical protein